MVATGQRGDAVRGLETVTGRPRTAALGLLTLALVACSGTDEVEGAGPSGDPRPIASPSPALVDWSAPSTVQLPDGWTIAPAEGDAPLLDVLLDGRPVGQLERLQQGPAVEKAARARSADRAAAGRP